MWKYMKQQLTQFPSLTQRARNTIIDLSSTFSTFISNTFQKMINSKTTKQALLFQTEIQSLTEKPITSNVSKEQKQKYKFNWEDLKQQIEWRYYNNESAKNRADEIKRINQYIQDDIEFDIHKQTNEQSDSEQYYHHSNKRRKYNENSQSSEEEKSRRTIINKDKTKEQLKNRLLFKQFLANQQYRLELMELTKKEEQEKIKNSMYKKNKFITKSYNKQQHQRNVNKRIERKKNLTRKISEKESTKEFYNVDRIFKIINEHVQSKQKILEKEKLELAKEQQQQKLKLEQTAKKTVSQVSFKLLNHNLIASTTQSRKQTILNQPEKYQIIQETNEKINPIAQYMNEPLLHAKNKINALQGANTHSLQNINKVNPFLKAPSVSTNLMDLITKDNPINTIFTFGHNSTKNAQQNKPKIFCLPFHNKSNQFKTATSQLQNSTIEVQSSNNVNYQQQFINNQILGQTNIQQNRQFYTSNSTLNSTLNSSILNSSFYSSPDSSNPAQTKSQQIFSGFCNSNSKSNLFANSSQSMLNLQKNPFILNNISPVSSLFTNSPAPGPHHKQSHLNKHHNNSRKNKVVRIQ